MTAAIIMGPLDCRAPLAFPLLICAKASKMREYCAGHFPQPHHNDNFRTSWQDALVALAEDSEPPSAA